MKEELEQIKKSVLETQKSVQKLETQIAKIQKRMLWASIWNFVKIIIIVGPILWGLWYFSPQIQAFYSAWRDLAEGVTALQHGEYVAPNESLQGLLDQYIENLQGQ